MELYSQNGEGRSYPNIAEGVPKVTRLFQALQPDEGRQGQLDAG